MSITQALQSRSTALSVAAVLVFAALAPVLLIGTADAAQVDDRYIKMNTSAPGAQFADPTAPTPNQVPTKYEVGFEIATNTLIRGIVVDICDGSDSPLVGQPCTSPASFTWDVTPNIVSATIGATNIAGWTWTSINSGRTLVGTDATGTTPAVNDEVVIVVDGITNPSDIDDGTVGNQYGTFFGRVLTTSTTGAATGYVETNGTTTAGYVDTGGMAMSINQSITVSARVEEQIKFCLYNAAAASDCASVGNGANGIEIPNANDPLQNGALETNTVADGGTNAYFGLESNALHGVDVRMYGGGGNQGVLRSGTNTISPFAFDGSLADGDDAVCDTVDANEEQFGLRIVPGANVTAATPYDGAAGCYGWDGEDAGADTDAVGSEYGDIIASTSAANNEAQSQLIFAAKAVATTQAGIYATSLNFIATGKY